MKTINSKSLAVFLTSVTLALMLPAAWAHGSDHGDHNDGYFHGDSSWHFFGVNDSYPGLGRDEHHGFDTGHHYGHDNDHGKHKGFDNDKNPWHDHHDGSADGDSGGTGSTTGDTGGTTGGDTGGTTGGDTGGTTGGDTGGTTGGDTGGDTGGTTGGDTGGTTGGDTGGTTGGTTGTDVSITIHDQVINPGTTFTVTYNSQLTVQDVLTDLLGSDTTGAYLQLCTETVDPMTGIVMSTDCTAGETASPLDSSLTLDAAGITSDPDIYLLQ